MTGTAITFAKDNRGMYAAEAAGYTFRLFNHDSAWFLFAKVTGEILGTEVKLGTMAEAKAVAARFIDTVATTTVSGEPGETVVGQALFAAVKFVNTPVAEQAELELDVAAPAEPVVVIACAAAKLATPAPAAELYTSANFTLMLRAARALADNQGGRVLILSALHGLLELDAVVEPYDVKMGDRGSIAVDVLAEQVAALNLGTVTTLLPHAYAARLDEAVALAGGGDLVDAFAEAPGIGYQRGVASAILRAHAA